MPLPAGTVTFLFTDIEEASQPRFGARPGAEGGTAERSEVVIGGVTRLWERHPDAMRLAATRCAGTPPPRRHPTPRDRDRRWARLQDGRRPVASMRAQQIAWIRAELPDQAFAAAWDEGRRMSPDEAVAYALRGDGQDAPI